MRQVCCIGAQSLERKHCSFRGEIACSCLRTDWNMPLWPRPHGQDHRGREPTSRPATQRPPSVSSICAGMAMAKTRRGRRSVFGHVDAQAIQACGGRPTARIVDAYIPGNRRRGIVGQSRLSRGCPAAPCCNVSKPFLTGASTTATVPGVRSLSLRQSFRLQHYPLACERAEIPNKHGLSRANLRTATHRLRLEILSLRPFFSKPPDSADLVRNS
jgi:hypothetical protein